MNLWDPQTGKLIRKLDRHEPGSTIVALALSPDGKRIVTSATDKTIRIWSTAEGKGPIVIQESAKK